jgi:hypothetical protein
VCRQHTYGGIWNLITNLPSDNAVILTVFMHDEVAGNCSHNTDFHTSTQDSASPQNFFSFQGYHLCLPPPHRPAPLILQYHTTYCRITSKGRYTKHVHDNIDILHSEFGTKLTESLKKYCNVLWHLSVAPVGVYWRLLWSTTVCHI